MPKGQAKPKSPLEIALSPAFERQKNLQNAARKVARIVAELPATDAREVLKLVLDAQTAPPPAEVPGDDQTQS